MSVKEINDKNFGDSIKSGVSAVDFYADWCGPCKMLSPIFSEVSDAETNSNFFKIDVDSNQETSSKYNVTSLPTIVIYKDGEEVNRLIGLQKKEAIKKALEI